MLIRTALTRALSAPMSSLLHPPPLPVPLRRRLLHLFPSPPSFSSFSSPKKWRPLVNTAAVLDLGGVRITRDDVVRDDDPANNIPDSIFSKLGLQLHQRGDHPIGILKNAIYDYFDVNYPSKFVKFDDLCPVVAAKENFDDVLVPADHVSRSYNDTYYVDAETVLRCHTSAHQAGLLRKGYTHFLVTGDVYRRDSIDATHYPVFHQMEGVRVFSPDEWSGTDATSYAASDLKRSLEGLAKHLFGAVEMRWVDTYFPFTNPSFELEINFQVQEDDAEKRMKTFCMQDQWRWNQGGDRAFCMQGPSDDSDLSPFPSARSQEPSRMRFTTQDFNDQDAIPSELLKILTHA